MTYSGNGRALQPWNEPARQARFATLWTRALKTWSLRGRPNRHGIRRHRGAMLTGQLTFLAQKALGVDGYTGLHVIRPLIRAGVGPAEAMARIVDTLAPVHGPLRWLTPEEQETRRQESAHIEGLIRAAELRQCSD